MTAARWSCIELKSYRTKVSVLNDIGFPVISKRIAGKIDMLQHPSDDNKTVRHAIITGECGAQGHFAKNSRMKLPQKWLNLFAGYENENEGVNYKIAPFQVSNALVLAAPADAYRIRSAIYIHMVHYSRPYPAICSRECILNVSERRSM